ncbi:hypothetical protein NKH77_31600 [Streptomyces sp. M19]
MRTGTAPDIAVLPTPGDLAEYAARGELTALDALLGPDRRRDYQAFRISRVRGHLYWIPVKADLKSVVWFDAARHSPRDLDALATDGARWCAGLDAESVSGWPGTDWIEDLLLQRRGSGVYQEWATGRLPWTDPRVAAAWRDWGRLFGRPDVAERVLTSHYAEVGGRMYQARPPCAMEHGASFSRLTRPRENADFVFSSRLLPGADRRSTAREVAGDYAAMFRDTRRPDG